MDYQHNQLADRTEEFALRIIRLFRTLPRSADAQVIGRQVLRSGTSIAANYRAAGRSRSQADFISKISVVVEEADETLLWLRLLVRAEIVSTKRMESLLAEGDELLRIFSASR